MKEFILKMKSKYPAFNFKLESKPRYNMYSIIVNLDAIGKADVQKELIEEEKNWDSVGQTMIGKTILDLQYLLNELQDDPSKTIQEVLKAEELVI